MKPAALIHLFALAALFTAHLAFAHELSGVRRALQIMSGTDAHVIALAVPCLEQT